MKQSELPFGFMQRKDRWEKVKFLVNYRVLVLIPEAHSIFINLLLFCRFFRCDCSLTLSAWSHFATSKAFSCQRSTVQDSDFLKAF